MRSLSSAPSTARPSSPPQRRAGRGWTLTTTLALLAAGSSVFLAGYFGLRSTTLVAVPLPTSALLTNQSIATWLARADLTPRNLAAVGVGSNGVNAIFASARSHLTDRAAALQSADDARASARADYETTLARVQAGLGSDQDIAGLPALLQNLQAADQAGEAALAAFRSAVLGQNGLGLSPVQQNAFDTLRANRTWEVPVQYKVVSRTESEWIALREALANARIAAQGQGEADQASAQRIADADALPAVSAARNALDAQLRAFKTAWNTMSNN